MTGKKVAILHYTAPPVIGGVEAVMTEHARLFADAGYPVAIVAGRAERGSLPPTVDLVTLPEIDSEFPANLGLARALEVGPPPPAFDDLSRCIETALAAALARADLVIAHNVLTMHFNLPLVAALHRLATTGPAWKLVAWCHDVSRYVRPSSGAPQRHGPPWDLLRTPRPEITYVAVSAVRQRHLAEAFGGGLQSIRVIANGVDVAAVLGLSAEGRHLAGDLGLLAADLILLMPIRITQAKNIEFALELTAALKRLGLRPRLVVTGPPDPHAPDGLAYFEGLLALRRQLNLSVEAHFLYEGTPHHAAQSEVSSALVGELYRLADVVFMPSHREGFGLPVLEAGLAGRPVFATEVPALEELGPAGEGVHLIRAGETPEQVAGRMADWAAQDAVHRLRRRVRQKYTWPALFEHDLRPLADELVGRGGRCCMNGEQGRPSRLVIVSNRGPYNLRQTKNGLRREKSIGGLVTSVLPMVERYGGVWIASGEPEGRIGVPPQRPQFTLRNLHLTEEQIRGYYHGFSNSALWPMCHYFLGRVRYEPSQWQTYEEVNRCFAEAVLEEAGENDVVWLHDYQLARAPLFVRQARPAQPIILFWHIPFPAVEVFRTLPWRSQVLEGMLAGSLVGFHIREFAQNFVEAAVDILGATAEGQSVRYNGRTTEVIARPIGIDFASVDRDARAMRTEILMQRVRRSFGEHTLVLGVERMDYTKGILERLRGVERLLEQHPEWLHKFSLIQIVTPSRTAVAAYREKKREIDEAVGRINGRFSDGIWLPVRYLYRAVSFSQLIAFYRAADIALVTPLRDGLNLVAKEYVASRIHGDGALILSEFAGVAQQLPEAILTNPYSPDDMAAALDATLRMPEDERRRRMEAMRRRVAEQDIDWWSREFLTRIGYPA